MIAVIAGLDTIAVDREVAGLASAHDPSGQSTSRLDGRTVADRDIVAQVSALGFFGAGRVVIVTDGLSRSQRGRKAGGDDAGTLDLAPIISATRPENLLILADSTIASVPAALRKTLPDDAIVSTFEPPRGQALVRWIVERAAEEGGSMSAAVARELAARLYPQSWSAAPTNPRYDRPPDMLVVAGEISKLVSAAWPDPVTSHVIQLMTPSGDNDQIFRFGDAAAEGNLRKTLPELQNLVDAGEDPARLSAQLAQQAELGAVVDAAEGRDAARVARDLGLASPGRVNAQLASRRRGGRPGGRAVAASLRADRDLKRGRLRTPADALYATLTELASDGTKPRT